MGEEKYEKIIPIFFALDDGYIPYMTVCLNSLIKNSSKKNCYVIKVLHTNIAEENQEAIMKYNKDNIKIEFVDLNYYVNQVKEKLYTRDYYTNTTYFRLFIPNLYPQYEKAIYIDADTVLLDDIANLYSIELGNNLIGGVTDGVINNVELLRDYVEKVVGVNDWRYYFNAGVLLMNLDELRKMNLQDKFLYSLEMIKFKVAQDQDYLNRICKGRVKLIDRHWDVMPIDSANIKDENKIKLIHYNLGDKPWHHDNVPFSKYFWEYAKDSEFYDYIVSRKAEYTEEKRIRDLETTKSMIELAKKEADSVGDDRRNFRTLMKRYGLANEEEEEEESTQKSPERIAVMEKIEELERQGKFDVDAEEDPPSIPLEAGEVDWLRKKKRSKVKAAAANAMALTFFKSLVNDEKVIIKEVKGTENLKSIKDGTGAIVTCNHFNPFDSMVVEKIFRQNKKQRRQKMFKVVREGNYTNFPGFYGVLMRNCYTLPLSQKQSTMAEFIKAVDEILERGDYVLVYPEQSLWWNYRKPKPLKPGAFKLAAKNNVPVLPIFITMEDTENIGEDGFPIQAYTVNIAEPIYPDEGKTVKENQEMMKETNFNVWKEIYEDFYQIPLEYTTNEAETIKDYKEDDE